jgi:hypothetical protein
MDRYPMCADQPAQIDCRVTSCRFYRKGTCTNVSPAITLNDNGRFICYSMDSGPADTDHLTQVALSQLGFNRITWNDAIPGYWLGIGEKRGEFWPRLEVRFGEYKGEAFCMWIIGTSWMVPLKHIQTVKQVKQLYGLLSGREI